MRPKLSWQIKTKILNEDVHHKGKVATMAQKSG